jgi:hypothetical protein
MESKRYAEACSKFAASQKAAPAIGTLLNLADCYEKNNQLASAWTRFREAITLAQRLGRTNREQTARERADKLEGRLIKLTIFPHASNIEVTLDGNPVEPSLLGTPIPIDAGKHSVHATAKKKKPFSKEIEVSDKAKEPSVDIPPLEDEPEPKEVKDTKPVDDTKVVERSSAHGYWSMQRMIGVAAAGVGIVGIGIGGVFGLKTSSTWTDAQSHCSPSLECDDKGVELASDAKTSGNVSTVAFIAGSLFLVGGGFLFFSASSAPLIGARSPLRVGVGPASIALGGQF